MMSHFRMKGFTLIELLIVMVLIGLSTSFIIPNMWQQYDQSKFYSERKQLESFISYAKQYTVYKGEILRLEIEAHSILILKEQLSETSRSGDELANNQNTEPGAVTSPEEGIQVNVLKRINFEALVLEPATYQLSSGSYFNTLSVKLSSKDKQRSEVIKI